MSKYVLDASALLALLHREQGHEKVAACLWQGTVSSVNLSEVAAKLNDQGMALNSTRPMLSALGLQVADFDETLAFEAAALRAGTRGEGLSLGDRACLATAAALGATAVTADRRWRKIRMRIKIDVIR